MNYREWLVYRAEQYETAATEPEVLRYTDWQNYQALKDWMRRSHADHGLNFAGGDQLAHQPAS